MTRRKTKAAEILLLSLPNSSGGKSGLIVAAPRDGFSRDAIYGVVNEGISKGNDSGKPKRPALGELGKNDC